MNLRRRGGLRFGTGWGQGTGGDSHHIRVLGVGGRPDAARQPQTGMGEGREGLTATRGHLGGRGERGEISAFKRRVPSALQLVARRRGPGPGGHTRARGPLEGRRAPGTPTPMSQTWGSVTAGSVGSRENAGFCLSVCAHPGPYKAHLSRSWCHIFTEDKSEACDRGGGFWFSLPHTKVMRAHPRMPGSVRKRQPIGASPLEGPH